MLKRSNDNYHEGGKINDSSADPPAVDSQGPKKGNTIGSTCAGFLKNQGLKILIALLVTMLIVVIYQVNQNNAEMHKVNQYLSSRKAAEKAQCTVLHANLPCRNNKQCSFQKGIWTDPGYTFCATQQINKGQCGKIEIFGKPQGQSCMGEMPLCTEKESGWCTGDHLAFVSYNELQESPNFLPQQTPATDPLSFVKYGTVDDAGLKRFKWNPDDDENMPSNEACTYIIDKNIVCARNSGGKDCPYTKYQVGASLFTNKFTAQQYAHAQITGTLKKDEDDGIQASASAGIKKMTETEMTAANKMIQEQKGWIKQGEYVCNYAESKNGKCWNLHVDQQQIGKQCGPANQPMCMTNDRMACQCNLPPFVLADQVANGCIIKEKGGMGAWAWIGIIVAVIVAIVVIGLVASAMCK